MPGSIRSGDDGGIFLALKKLRALNNGQSVQKKALNIGDKLDDLVIYV